MTQKAHTLDIHPTAEIHPSVVLEGNVTIGAYCKIEAGTVITGSVSIGDHSHVACNVTIRGRNKIGSYVQIYDNANLEGGRGAGVGTANEADQSVIGDGAWINHGATMHGCQIAEGAIIGINVALDYNCKVGRGSIVANGSSAPVDTIIPDNCVFEGVPGKIVKQNVTDDDRLQIMGLLPSARVRFFGQRYEQSTREGLGL